MCQLNISKHVLFTKGFQILELLYYCQTNGGGTSLLPCKGYQIVSVLVFHGLLLQVIHQGEAIKGACGTFLGLVTLAESGWEHGILKGQ